MQLQARTSVADDPVSGKLDKGKMEDKPFAIRLPKSRSTKQRHRFLS